MHKPHSENGHQKAKQREEGTRYYYSVCVRIDGDVGNVMDYFWGEILPPGAVGAGSVVTLISPRVCQSVCFRRNLNISYALKRKKSATFICSGVSVR